MLQVLYTWWNSKNPKVTTCFSQLQKRANWAIVTSRVFIALSFSIRQQAEVISTPSSDLYQQKAFREKQPITTDGERRREGGKKKGEDTIETENRWDSNQPEQKVICSYWGHSGVWGTCEGVHMKEKEKVFISFVNLTYALTVTYACALFIVLNKVFLQNHCHLFSLKKSLSINVTAVNFHS